MVKVRPQTIGAAHARIAGLYRTYLGDTKHRKQRSALRHLCTHLDAYGRLLGQPDAVHSVISERSFRDRQRAVFGTARQTLLDLHLAARSAVHHDRVDLLAETVDWYGRTVQAAQAGLQGWSAAHDRQDWQRVHHIAEDCGNPHLGRSLLAFEAWCMLERGESVPEKMTDVFSKQTPPSSDAAPYGILADAILKRSGLQEAMAVTHHDHTSPHHTLAYPIPTQQWPATAWTWIEYGTGTVRDLATTLAQTPGSDWGRQLATVLHHASRRGVTPDGATRISVLLHALMTLSWSDIPVREAVSALNGALCDALLDVDFDIVGWWRKMLGHIRSDHRAALSTSTRHILRIAQPRPIAGDTVDLVLDLATTLTEPVFRPRVINLVPETLSELLTAHHRDRAWLHRNLVALVTLEASAVREVTSDNLMFGIGRALGSRRDRHAVHLAFQEIRHPWIRGQVLRVQRPEDVADLDIADLPAQLRNPLAQRFALAHIFEAIGATCSTATLESGIRTAAMCASYPEVRIACLEGVCSALGRRSDITAAMQALWTHHGHQLDVEDGYAWRILDLLLGQGVRPEHCPKPLASLINTRLTMLSPAQHSALAAHDVGWAWELDVTDDIGANVMANDAPISRLLLSNTPPFQDIERRTSRWGPDEWALWTNSLRITDHEGLSRLSAPAKAFLLTRLGPARPRPSSITAILALLDPQPNVDLADWTTEHRLLVPLARNPASFDPNHHNAYGSHACWQAVMAWMAMGDRSNHLIGHLHHRAVRQWLDDQQQWVTRSEYGRRYPIVRYPGRALLSWLTLLGMPAVRPAQMLIAEILTRCATPSELDRIRDQWLAPHLPEDE